MDQPDKRNKGKKYPRVPIKTYKWEDIRRSRKRGGYPWTHLYKPPFSEELDIEPYTMEALRKSKSASTLGKSDGVEISEISGEPAKGSFGIFLDIPEKMDTLQIITEPDDHSIKNSTGSLVIEECDTSDAGSHKPENIGLESADSSDNISQYLDKEERGPVKTQTVEESRTHTISGENNANKTEEDNQNIESEEKLKRKRKLSAESKLSLTKQAVLKKIKDTKNKIKVPKLTFPTSKLKRTAPKRTKNSPPEIKKDVKKPNTQSKPSKPVYIHIPLKPPPGQTDEFSYLEFEEKSDKKPQQTKKLGSFRDMVKSIKKLQEAKSDGAQNKSETPVLSKISDEDIKTTSEIENKLDEKSDVEEIDTTLQTESKSDENISEPNAKSLEKSPSDTQDESITVRKDKEKQKESKEKLLQQAENNVTTEPSDIIKPSKTVDQLVKGVDNKNTQDTTTEDETDTPMEEDKNANDVFDKLFEARANASKEEEVDVPRIKSVRSKSAEPERRRKLSLESSYSRKSLSKLGILKKLKETTDKIKNTLSRSNSKKQDKVKEPVQKKEEKAPKKLKPQKPVEPVYIHIPLKPPEGQTDEFSYLEYQENPSHSSQNEENKAPSNPPESPIQSDGVQFIILTAPSDDEILDYHSSDVPETPSSENKLFFSKEDLKVLARDIVDEISSLNKKLDTVSEETSSGKVRIEEINGNIEVSIEPDDDKSIPKEKMVVDEEDGLNESVKKQETPVVDPNLETKPEQEVATDQPAELKSNLKGENLKEESSPLIKKKVSFKRRSKTPKDGIYEDIQIPKPAGDSDKVQAEKDKRQLPASGTSQSMSVDEEKTYLDDKIIKTTSLEEDYNKWSKINDHEYEPINPPPDNETFPSTTPTVRTVDINQELKFLPSTPLEGGTTNNGITINEVSHQIDSSVPLQKPTDVTNPTPVFAPVSDEQPQEPSSSISGKDKEGPSKFQLALKQTTDQFKSKLHNIKKPHITMPDKAKFRKFSFEKPKFNFPKIPDTTKVNLPSFKLPHRSSAKRSLKERQQSTESNDGDSKKPIFDFSTYPRIFKKKPKAATTQNEEVQNFATVPRTSRKTATDSNKSETTVKWGVSDTLRISPNPEEHIDIKYDVEEPVNIDFQEKPDDDREDSVERRMASHIRYEDDIDIEDEYERENNEINRDDYIKRWDYGNFNPDPNQEYTKNYKNTQYKVTDLDSPEEPPPDQRYNFNSNNNKENFSSGSSLGMPRVGGVLEEIDSDEFFLRQKGISQDNIEVGMLLSSEIREAFRTPENALSKMQNTYGREYDPRGSNQSLPEAQAKRKPVKKPKRKKTPHASQEKIPYAEESGDDDLDDLPPSRPRRRSKRTRKPKQSADVIPYQETISLDANNSDTRLFEHRESLGILGDDEQEAETTIMYENELMEGKEQPQIKITDPYKNFEFVNIEKYRQNSNESENLEERPAAPPRKPKSLRSLNLSENDSILEDLILNQDIPGPENETVGADLESAAPVSKEPPRRPSRMKSHTSSQSVIISQPDDESLSRRTESFTSENQIPCVEEPCVQDIRDYMGYAIIDKQKVRDPPLPPPRTPPRRKRSIRSNKSSDNKFFTVPRPLKDSDAPVRPLRNYSTLGQARRGNETPTYANKENIDIIQYIEIDDEPNRDLQSGEIIKKMKDRPLPAPPRPPRKSRPLRDITSQENIMLNSTQDDVDDKLVLEETEVSTQTEPLPDDFVCEEVTQEVSDTILSPSNINRYEQNSSVEKQSSMRKKRSPLADDQISSTEKQSPLVEKRLITPSYFTHEETITHGSLVVQSLSGDKILPDSEITSVSKERIIPITTESDGDTSSIPEDFKKLKDPSQENISQTQLATSPPVEQNVNAEMDVLKAQRLQVSDLDVDTLTVNKLLAGKIIVSEIDSNNIQAYEISSKSGALKVGEIELPPGVIQEILRAISSDPDRSSKTAGTSKPEVEKDTLVDDDSFQEQKKTSVTNLTDFEVSPQASQTHSNSENQLMETEHCTPLKTSSEHHTDSFEPEISNEIQTEFPQPPSRLSESESLEEQIEHLYETQHTEVYPQRPPRQYEKLKCDNFNSDEILREPEVDDEPPPRPPEPQLEYLPSQPPASFYALRAQKYIDTLGESIPAVPRRRRQTKSKPISRSSSEDSAVTPVSRRFHSRPEASIAQLTGQLVRACGSAADSALKRLITHITYNVLENADGKQDLHVMVIILLVLIAGLILLGYGDEKTVVHLHHWEYFNPPKDM